MAVSLRALGGYTLVQFLLFLLLAIRSGQLFGVCPLVAQYEQIVFKSNGQVTVRTPLNRSGKDLRKWLEHCSADLPALKQNKHEPLLGLVVLDFLKEDILFYELEIELFNQLGYV
ncbi:hypothetical protein N9K75_00785 [bacterium]|nr:hypothetical protein [bacterium]